MAKERPDLKPLVGQKLTVIAWLWARTVKSPNPAFAHVDVPLASTFMLSTKAGKEAYVEPVIEEGLPLHGEGGEAEGRGGGEERHEARARANFRCLMSGTPIAGDYIKAEGKAGRWVRADGHRRRGRARRVYLPPTREMEASRGRRSRSGSRKSRCRGPRWFSRGTIRLKQWSDLSPLASSWR